MSKVYMMVTITSRKLPSTKPMISGRTYWTLAAECRPRAPEISRRKQAMQNPMLEGFPQ